MGGSGFDFIDLFAWFAMAVEARKLEEHMDKVGEEEAIGSGGAVKHSWCESRSGDWGWKGVSRDGGREVEERKGREEDQPKLRMYFKRHLKTH